MITKVFSIFDSKAQMFNVPFFMPTTPAAIRSFTDLVNDPQTLVCKHPADFVLYELGEFDDSVGKMTNYSEHHHLGVASQYKASGMPTNGAGQIMSLAELDKISMKEEK